MTAQDDFHRHMQECSWCREHRFRLCPTGARLIEPAAMQALENLKSRGAR